MPKRSCGTGSLAVCRGARGRESWYGQWRVGGRRVTRKLDVKREAATRTGLTRAQAERRLQRLIDAETSAPVQTRVGVEEAGDLPLHHLESLQPPLDRAHHRFGPVRRQPRRGVNPLGRDQPDPQRTRPAPLGARVPRHHEGTARLQPPTGTRITTTRLPPCFATAGRLRDPAQPSPTTPHDHHTKPSARRSSRTRSSEWRQVPHGSKASP
jgi:hypothetical protein